MEKEMEIYGETLTGFLVVGNRRAREVKAVPVTSGNGVWSLGEGDEVIGVLPPPPPGHVWVTAWYDPSDEPIELGYLMPGECVREKWPEVYRVLTKARDGGVKVSDPDRLLGW